MDLLKRRLNEILKVFKAELDAKFARKLEALQNDNSDITSTRQPLSQAPTD